MKKSIKFTFVLLTMALLIGTLSACDLFGGTDTPVTPPVVTIVSYTVTLDSNGGSAMSPITVSATNSLIAEPQTDPVRIGYNFLGWYKSKASADNAATTPTVDLWIFTGDSADRVSSNITLFAGWENNNKNQACDISDTYFESANLTVNNNGTATDVTDDYRSLVVANSVSEFDFTGITVSEDAIYGIYKNSVAKSNLVYVSNGAAWAEDVEALPNNLTRVSQYSSDYGSTEVSFPQGNNAYYIVVYAEERLVSKTYKVVITRGCVYSVTFVNDSNILTVPANEGLSVDAPAAALLRAGYDFNYWWYVSDNTKYKFITTSEATAEVSATVVKGNMTVYATSTAEEYTVTLNTAGITVTGDTSYRVKYDNVGYTFAVPTRIQATFIGWYHGETKVTDATGKLIGAWKISGSENLTLTSQWDMNKYNLNLVNTNALAGAISAGGLVNYGSTTAITATPSNGYQFVGWSTASVNPQTYVTTLTSYNYQFTSTSDVTLYAYWAELTYDIVVTTGVDEAAGGAHLTDVEGVVYPNTTLTESAYRSEGAVQLPLFVYYGYTFNGWYYLFNSGSGNVRYPVTNETGLLDLQAFIALYCELNQTETVAQSYNLYANYTTANYQVQIDSNAEDPRNIEMELNANPVAALEYIGVGEVDFVHGTEIQLTALSSITCTFEGWFVDGSLTPVYEVDGITLETELVIFVDKDTNVYAKYSVNTYTITYTNQVITVEYGANFIWPSVPKVTGDDAAGMSFAYFYVDNGLPDDQENAFTDENGAGKMNIAGNITLKAMWLYKESGIIVRADNSAAGTVFCELESAFYKDNVSLLATTNTGYTFKGWYKVNNGVIADIAASTNMNYTFSMPAAAVEYVAVWDANRYMVTITNYNGATLATSYAVFGENVFLNKLNGDVENTNDLATAITTDMYVRQYQFNGWQADYNGQVRVITGTNGLLNTIWDIDSNITLTPNRSSVFQISSGTITGISDYGKADCYTGIEIDAEIEGQSITAIGANAFSGWTTLQSVKISKNVVSIGANAFYGCTGLTSATFTLGGLSGSTASALTTIGDYAFRNCTSLTGISFPRLVINYGSGILYGSTGLTSVTYNGGIVLGRLFGTVNAANSTAVVQNGTTYYIPTGLAAVVFISGTGNLADYVMQNVHISNVTFPDTITNIGVSAFENSTISAFNVAVIVEGVTTVENGMVYLANLETIGRNAFKGSALTSIQLPANIGVVGSGAFSDCLSLASVTFSLYSDTVFESMFKGCTALNALSAQGGITTIEAEAFSGCTLLSQFSAAASNVTSIGENAFYGCAAFTNANIITDFDNALSIGYNAFKNSGLSTPVIGGIYYSAAYDSIGATFNMDSYDVSYIADRAFETATAMTAITLPKELISIGASAFQGLTALTTVNIEALAAAETYALQYVFKNAFYGCTGLTSVVLPDTISIISLGSFYGTTGLTKIFFTAVNGNNTEPAETVSDFGQADTIDESAFASSGLTAIALPDTLRTLNTSAFANCISLTAVTFATGDCSIIPNNAFKNCTSLNTLNLSTDITKIGDYAFYNTALTALDAPDGALLQSIGKFAFAHSTYADSALTTVTLEAATTTIGENAFENNRITNFEASGLNSVAANLFKNCVNLATVTLASNISSIGDYAFYRCSSLIYFNEDRIFNSSIATVGNYAFYDCSSLRGHTIEENSSLKSIGDSAFRNCILFNELYIPAGVTYIGDQAFSGCSNISSLTFAEDSTLTEISYAAFKNNSSIQTLVLPNTITTVETEAFYGCSSLTTVTFGTAIQSICDSAFAGCTGLKGSEGGRVTFTGSSAPVLGSGVFVTGTFFYVQELYEAEFKNAATWASYKVYVYTYTI